MLHTRTVKITSASTTFDVNIAVDLKMIGVTWDQSISIEVEFTDQLTGKLASARAQVTLTYNKYKIIFVNPDNFKPGLPFSYKVTVQKYDGSPAPVNSMFSVTTTYNYEASKLAPEKYSLDAAGTKEVIIEKVPVGTTVIKITVSFQKL